MGGCLSRAGTLLVLAVLTAACSKTPTAPAAVATVALSDLSATGALYTPSTIRYSMNFTVTETSGRVGITIGGATFTLADGRQLPAGLIELSVFSIPAGQSRRYTTSRQLGVDAFGQPAVMPNLTLNVQYTDDNGHAGTASGTAPLTLGNFTIASVVTDRTSGAGLPDSSIEVTPLPPDNRRSSGRTDANGYYSIAGAPGGNVTITASHVGYVTGSLSANVLKDNTRVDLSLSRDQ